MIPHVRAFRCLAKALLPSRCCSLWPLIESEIILAPAAGQFPFAPASTPRTRVACGPGFAVWPLPDPPQTSARASGYGYASRQAGVRSCGRRRMVLRMCTTAKPAPNCPRLLFAAPGLRIGTHFLLSHMRSYKVFYPSVVRCISSESGLFYMLETASPSPTKMTATVPDQCAFRTSSDPQFHMIA